MAQVVFNDQTGVVVPDTKSIRDDLATAIQQALQTNPNDPLINVDSSSPLGQVIDLIVAELEAKNAEIAFLANQYNPAIATGVYLDSLAGLYGLTRKVSEPTIVVCTCKGLKNTVIPFGAVVRDTLGNTLTMITAEGATIGDDGTCEAQFATVEHGPIEISAHTVTQIVTVIPGWDSVDNEAAGITGRDIEPDGELLNRMKESYAINANGTVANIQSNLAELNGVLDCVVLENYTNATDEQYSVELEPHSIAVCIVGGDDEEIAKTIFERKSAGCGTNGETEVTYVDTEHFDAVYTYKIIRPTAEAFKVKVEFFGDELNTDTQTAVKNAIVQDFLGELKNPRVTLASTVYASRFYQCVQGVTDAPIKAITIGLGDGALATSVDIPANESPALTAKNVTLSFDGE